MKRRVPYKRMKSVDCDRNDRAVEDFIPSTFGVPRKIQISGETAKF